MDPGPPAVPSGDERSGSLRRGRRASRIGQTRRIRGGRGRDGSHARPPLPGGVVMTEARPCDIDELRTLFLFEKLSAEQLAFLCERGHVELHEPGFIYREGDPATCFYVLLEGSITLLSRVG